MLDFREGFYDFVLICCYKLNPPQYVMGTGLGRLGLFSRLSEVTIFITDACMLKLVREGEDSSPSPLENFLLILNVNLSLIILNWHIFSLELIYFVWLVFFLVICKFSLVILNF